MSTLDLTYCSRLEVPGAATAVAEMKLRIHYDVTFRRAGPIDHHVPNYDIVLESVEIGPVMTNLDWNWEPAPWWIVDEVRTWIADQEIDVALIEAVEREGIAAE